MTFRDYQPDDLEAIVQIGNDAWQPIYDMCHEGYGDALGLRRRNRCNP